MAWTLDQTLPMRAVQIVAGSDLTDSHQSEWTRLQAAHPHLDSPFLAPDLTRLVASVRDDVVVAVMIQEDRAVGFFPFLRSAGKRARPVVSSLTECQGPICAPGLLWDPVDLVRRCGLRAWYFDHLPASHAAFRAHSWGTVPSPYANLEHGFQAYEADVRRKSSVIAQVRRMERKMEREIGRVRFVMHTTDEDVFDALRAWKADQYRRTGRLQVLAYDWVVRLLDRVRCYESERFAGVLSALYAGDRLAAVHLGIRTRRVLHVWFPAYNRVLDQYSPGSILLLRLTEQAAALGIERIEFGPGEERYKQQFKSGDTELLVGGVDLKPGRAGLRRGWHAVKQWIRRSRHRRYLESPIIATRRCRQWLAFR